MSRIGIKPVLLPSGVTAEIKGSDVHLKGSKGELTVKILPEVSVGIDGSVVTVTRKDDSDDARARHGLIRVLIANAALGVSTGYEKKLEIIGVGYKAQIKGKALVLNLGHSHPVNMAIPQGIEVGQDEKNKNILIIRGIDKQLVGQFAAEIRELRMPEPYKGKGVRYFGEQVRRKPGKAAAKASV
ncbi:MAG: 50S ribosomal protein L6 [Candidatus Peribacteraceae bacterium]|nr:50S ribosomal protein L6 [Candidatus Peribacteraceae bacterium]